MVNAKVARADHENRNRPPHFRMRRVLQSSTTTAIMASFAQMENTILTLIPTSTTEIPEALTATAKALFTQSKQKIITLKPQEEPARTYICAHLACERYNSTSDDT